MSRKYMNSRWCVRCGRKAPTPFVMKMAEQYYFGGNVLDIGCGNGRNSIYMQTYMEEYFNRGKLHKVYGLDMACPSVDDNCKNIVLGHDEFPCLPAIKYVMANYVLMFLTDKEMKQVAGEIDICTSWDDGSDLTLTCIVEMYPAKDSQCKTEESCERKMKRFACMMKKYGWKVTKKWKLRMVLQK